MPPIAAGVELAQDGSTSDDQICESLGLGSLSDSVDIVEKIFEGESVCEDPGKEIDKRIDEQLHQEINKLLDKVIQSVISDALTGIVHV